MRVIPSAATLVATIASAAVAGLARGFSGFGGALIFMPLASAAVGPRLAAPLLMVVDTVATAPLIPRAWRGATRPEVAALVVGALVGVPLGVRLLLVIDPTHLRWGMCGLAFAMLALLASGWRYQGRPGLPLSVGVGGLSGVFSGAAQMGGPPVVAYWLGGVGTAARVRANIVLYFAASNVISAASYILGGLLTEEVLVLAVCVVPAYGAGLWCGSHLFGFASEAAFRRICFGLIGLAAVLGLPLWHW